MGRQAINRTQLGNPSTLKKKHKKQTRNNCSLEMRTRSNSQLCDAGLCCLLECGENEAPHRTIKHCMREAAPQPRSRCKPPGKADRERFVITSVLLDDFCRGKHSELPDAPDSLTRPMMVISTGCVNVQPPACTQDEIKTNP